MSKRVQAPDVAQGSMPRSRQINKIMGKASDLKKRLLNQISLYISKINFAENDVELSCDVEEKEGRMFIKVEMSDNILHSAENHQQRIKDLTFYRTNQRTLKYDQSHPQSANPKCNSDSYKSPSLQNKLFNERRSQLKTSNSKKTRRGPNKSPAKRARDRKRHDDLRQRFRSEEMETPSAPESRASDMSDINPEKDNEPERDFQLTYRRSNLNREQLYASALHSILTLLFYFVFYYIISQCIACNRA